MTNPRQKIVAAMAQREMEMQSSGKGPMMGKKPKGGRKPSKSEEYAEGEKKGC